MGIMLVYDITNEKTFDDIVKWLRNIDEVCNFVLKLSSLNFCLMDDTILKLSLVAC